MKKRNKLSTALLLGLALPAMSQASLLFDPDGTTATLTPVTITNFDWSPDSVLADGGNQAIVNYLNNQIDGGARSTEFELYAHATLQAGTNGSDSTLTPNAPATQMVGTTLALTEAEYTAVVGFTESISSVVLGTGSNTATASFDYVNDGNSFFAMFYDTSANSDKLTGTGYTDGTRIFEGGVVSTAGGAFTVDPADGTTALFDQAGGDGDQWGGQETVTGSGAQETITLHVDTSAGTYIDRNFFINELIEALIVNIDLSVPFEGDNNPSMAFSSSPTVNGDVIPNLGSVNGGIGFDAVTGLYTLGEGGPDFEFSTDNNSVWRAVNVPEPGMLALMGFGLGLLSFVSSRRKSSL